MAKGDIKAVTQRPLTDAETDLADWIEGQESKTIDRLEAGARQIITLITTFYGFLFGILALGSDKFEAALARPGVAVAGWLAIGLLLAALIAALGVVMPQRYSYGEARLDQMKAAYRQMLGRKSRRLQAALWLFGGGLATFATLLALLLLARAG